MTTLFDANLIVLIVALLIGVAVGWWMFRRSAARRVGTDRQDKVAAPPAATPIPPTTRGMTAATTVPKTSSNATSANGSAINSARCRSRWLTVSMSA